MKKKLMKAILDKLKTVLLALEAKYGPIHVFALSGW